MYVNKSTRRKVGRQTVEKSYFPPEGGRIALSANERIADFLDFAVQAKDAYANKLAPDKKIGRMRGVQEDHSVRKA